MAKHLLNLHGIGGVVSSRYAAGGAPQTAINQLVRYWKPQGIRSVVIIPISQADASFAQVGPNLHKKVDQGIELLAIPPGAGGIRALEGYHEKIDWLFTPEVADTDLAAHWSSPESILFSDDLTELPPDERGFAIITKRLLKSRFGMGIDFSLAVMDEGFAPRSVLVSSAERTKRPEIGITVAKQLRQLAGMPKTELVPRYVPGVPDVKINYLNSLGAIVQSLEVGVEQRGATTALLVGGDATRLFRLVENKSWVPFGARNNGEAALRTSSLVLRQLPKGGKDWVVVIACDNVAIPDGPLTAMGNPLSTIKQGAAWFGLSTEVVDKDQDDVNHLKELGLFIVGRDGSIVTFAEKKHLPDDETKFDLPFALKMLEMHGGGRTVEANTYIMAFRKDVARFFAEGYNRPTKKDDRPFHETYSLDLSKHFTTPAYCSIEHWESNRPDHFHPEDWTYLQAHAKAVVAKAQGIAGVSVGFDETNWSDMGSLQETYDRNMALGFGSGGNQRIGQRLGNLPEHGKPRNSKVDRVRIGAHSIIGESAFLHGGAVADNTIILSSLIRPRLSVPSEAIILGSELYDVRFERSGPRLLVGVHQSPGSPELTLRGGMAYFTIYLENGEHYITGVPIEYVGSEKEEISAGAFARDPFVGHYLLNGKLKDHPMLGIPGPLTDALVAKILQYKPKMDPEQARVTAINNIKRVTSIARVLEAQEALKRRIRDLARGTGLNPRVPK